MNACSFINRLMSRIPEAQRTKYLELRSANPQLRMRSDVNLGPRVSVNVKNRERSSLERPQEYFCRLDVYLRDNPGKTVKESEKVWEFLDGVWIEGVPWLKPRSTMLVRGQDRDVW